MSIPKNVGVEDKTLVVSIKIGLKTKNNKVNKPNVIYKAYVVIIPVSNSAIFSPVFFNTEDIPCGPTVSIIPLSKTFETI